MNKIAYTRIILKISGEALIGQKQHGIDTNVIKDIVCEIESLLTLQVQVGIVMGGGNFIRGARLNSGDISRITGDYLGMFATMMNALAMQDIFLSCGIATKVVSALPVVGLLEEYQCQRVDGYLREGKVVIFAGGTGNPLVTTDSALCLRGIELGADLLLKATTVDGVYTADPKKDPQAKLYRQLDYVTAIDKKLAIMDQTAFFMGRDHNMKICIYNLRKKGALKRIVSGLEEGTLVGGGGKLQF